MIKKLKMPISTKDVFSFIFVKFSECPVHYTFNISNPPFDMQNQNQAFSLDSLCKQEDYETCNIFRITHLNKNSIVPLSHTVNIAKFMKVFPCIFCMHQFGATNWKMCRFIYLFQSTAFLT